MTYFVQSTSVITTNSRAITIASGDELIVLQGVTVETTGGIAVYNASKGALDSHGFILAMVGVSFADATGASNNVITNEGTIQAFPGGIGVLMAGNHQLYNYGSIDVPGLAGTGLKTTGPGTVYNYGTISAADGIVNAARHSSDHVNLVNVGLVNAVDKAYDGSGSAATESIRNVGTIRGNIFLGNGTGDIVDTRKGLLTGEVHGGNGADHLLGSSSYDKFFGGAGNDVLSGYDASDILDGGLGRDKLSGGAGADTFVFDTKLGPTNVDTITDFDPYIDQIQIDHHIFTSLAAGHLNSNAFYIGSKAHDTDDRIIYNKDTGALYYDADGSGTRAAVRFAVLHPHLPVSASNFLVT